jgi:hypothetical protein
MACISVGLQHCVCRDRRGDDRRHIYAYCYTLVIPLACASLAHAGSQSERATEEVIALFGWFGWRQRSDIGETTCLDSRAS